MSLIHTSLLLFRTHLARSLTGRRGWIMVCLACLPVAIAFVVSRFDRGASPADIVTHLGWMLSLQVIVPILSLVGGSAVVAEEIEDRTVTYLFSRPIPRASILFGRWLATATFLVLLLAGSTALLCLVASGAKSPGPSLAEGIAPPLLLAVVAGGLVYSALFATLGVFVKHPMLVGLAYAFAIEALFANLPGSTQSLSIQYYLRSLIAAGGNDHWKRVENFAESFSVLGRATSSEAITTLATVLVVALVLGAWRISRREYVLTA
jgi:ABC-type transport system involved in multi-copper enzyme maturation permease subunit